MTTKQGLRVSLFGVARSGKDTIASYLQKKHKFKLYCFSTSLKEAVRHLFGFTTQQLYGPEKDVVDLRYGITPRKTMTFFGTDVIAGQAQLGLTEEMRRNFWIHRLFSDMNLSSSVSSSSDSKSTTIVTPDNIISTGPISETDNVCIVDGRRQVELDACVKHKFVPFLVNRKSVLKPDITSLHETEQFVAEQSHAVMWPLKMAILSSSTVSRKSLFTNHFDNNSDFENLYQQVDRVIKAL